MSLGGTPPPSLRCQSAREGTRLAVRAVGRNVPRESARSDDDAVDFRNETRY